MTIMKIIGNCGVQLTLSGVITANAEQAQELNVENGALVRVLSVNVKQDSNPKAEQT
jgi:hypothetical protein